MSKGMEEALAEQPGATRAEKIKSLQRNMLGAPGADKAFMAELRDLIRETKGGARVGGGGGMSPADIEKVPGKKPLKMKKGGAVSSASKRADGCAVKGKTRGRMV